MVERCVAHFDANGPVTCIAPTFEGGHADLVPSGDGDLVTMDTLWDLKVIRSRPKPFHTLQVYMYYLMGQRSGAVEFLSVRRIGLFNPRLHVSYVLDVDSIAEDVKEAVECEVMGYDSPNPWDSVVEPDRLM